MSIRGSNFENQHPFASDHALVWERCIPDGLLYGVDMSFTSTLFTLGTGFMLVAGRMFEITAAENISISPGSGYARVYVAIDTGGAATENSFDQVSFGVDYAANLDSFAELTQGEININQGTAVYQAEVAVLEINSSGVTAIERQMELVSPGAGTGAFAAIAVTYPAGSTVIVTDGKITYTAPNTSGTALFIIPYAATWTVTATDGTETASETVEITTEGQSVNVELDYLVPKEYQKVKYLQGANGAYINTGYLISNKTNTEIVVDDTTENVNGSCIFGSRPGYPSPSWVWFTSASGGVGLNVNADYGSVYTGRPGVKTLRNEWNQFYVDDTLVKTTGTAAFTVNAAACFFAMYDRGSWGAVSSNARLRSAIIREGGEIVKHYVPCYRKADGVAGLWERVEKVFLTSANSGTFIVGENI